MGDAHARPTILDLNFIRPGSLSLTSRGPEESPMWASDEIKTIQITLGLCAHPVAFRVREFIPGPSDAVSRTWLAPDGRTPRSVTLAPYTIADPVEAAAVVRDYIRDNCMCFDEVARESHPAIRAVYGRVADHVKALRAAASADNAGPAVKNQLELFERYCPLWFGIRNMMGSAWLCGPETLGMEPIDEAGYPLRGKISVPRQVVQTVGCFWDQATRPRQVDFLEALREVFEPGLPDGRRYFFTLFLLVFVILHECEDISKDRERYARQNYMTTVFSLPEYVRDLHQNAKQLISHWLAYTRAMGVNFSSKQELEASLDFLDKPQRDLIVQSYDTIVNQTSPSIRASPSTWLQDLCFVTHMFNVPWAPDAMYRGD